MRSWDITCKKMTAPHPQRTHNALYLWEIKGQVLRHCSARASTHMKEIRTASYIKVQQAGKIATNETLNVKKSSAWTLIWHYTSKGTIQTLKIHSTAPFSKPTLVLIICPCPITEISAECKRCRQDGGEDWKMSTVENTLARWCDSDMTCPYYPHHITAGAQWHLVTIKGWGLRHRCSDCKFHVKNSISSHVLTWCVWPRRICTNLGDTIFRRSLSRCPLMLLLVTISVNKKNEWYKQVILCVRLCKCAYMCI